MKMLVFDFYIQLIYNNKMAHPKARHFLSDNIFQTLFQYSAHKCFHAVDA